MPGLSELQVTRHTILKPAQFVTPEARFRHVHMDNVGRLPDCEGHKYILTIIDRFSRWTEAIPLWNFEAATVCRAFFGGRVTRFRSPKTLSTDQGRKFEYRRSESLLKLVGCRRIRITPYDPASNGMIERFRRALKAAIMCHATREWMLMLSTVMLGLRTSVLDCGSSSAEYLYGTTLRIHGEFVIPDVRTPDAQAFLDEFRVHMKSVKPIPVDHRYKEACFVQKSLATCSHVFLRLSAARRSPDPPYSGTHRVSKRIGYRVIKIDVDGTGHPRPQHYIPLILRKSAKKRLNFNI
ncbi:uncharacterized protein LOC117182901 [Belonocnema kinseyi]|uniref:uncharacterized protein LOC117182901 n=1 Tax=Belonocnema kinseyi TaxID=2817044 RepID=UPI00143D5766|nr:uncharacterized protein LOC117182901 [Belonocnema kinseyi]